MLHVKSCGVATARKSGKLIIKLYVENAELLRGLRITQVLAFLDGAYAQYYLSTRTGNLHIIEADGVTRSSHSRAAEC